MTALAFAVMVLATARITRLVTTDEITYRWRRPLANRRNRDTGPTFMAQLVYCNWCVSVWIALAAALVARFTGLVHTWSWMVWAWLAIAGGAGLLLGWQSE
jgi:hypothetical protein